MRDVMVHTFQIFFVSAKLVTRSGELVELSSKDIKFSYRQCDLPQRLYNS